MQCYSSYDEVLQLVNHTVFFDVIYQSGKNHILTLESESDEHISSLKELEKVDCHVSYIEMDENGLVSIDALKKAINPKVSFVSMSWASGQTGIVQPIYEIGTYLAEKGILFHVDVSSIIGKLFFRLQDYPIDFLTINGNLIHAYPNSSVLAVAKHSFPLEQSILSTKQSSVERHSNSGFSLIEQTMEVASKEILDGFDEMCGRVAMMRNFFEEEILQKCEGTESPFKERERLPNIATITFPKIHAELFSYSLLQEGIVCEFADVNHLDAAKRYKMCSKARKNYEMSGLDTHSSSCTLSFSLSRYQTEEELEKASFIVCNTFHKLKTYSEEMASL